MGSQYSTGKHAIAECDRCGFRYKLKQLKSLVIKTKNVNILVCPECWEPDQPQLSLGLYPVNDPQAVRNPRPDTSYYEDGNNGAGGSRVIQWGWNPVGFAQVFDEELTVPNDLVAQGNVGEVTVTAVQNPPVPVVPVVLPASITGTSTADSNVSETAGAYFGIASPSVSSTTWQTYYTNVGGTGTNETTTWLNSGSAADYEFRWTLSAGDIAKLYLGGGRTGNVWYSSFGFWGVRQAYPNTGTVTASGLLEIRNIATSTVVASTTLTLSATLTP